MKQFFENHPEIKDTCLRALKTFWQAAIAYIIISIGPIMQDIQHYQGWDAIKTVLLSIGLGALSAGLSALYNGVLRPIVDKRKEAKALEDEEK